MASAGLPDESEESLELWRKLFNDVANTALPALLTIFNSCSTNELIDTLFSSLLPTALLLSPQPDKAERSKREVKLTINFLY
jgi:hypothetical protein